ncbi:unnamed protein product, partial [marine sediment metagenome]
ETSQEERIKMVYEHATELMKGGLSASKIEGQLVKEGLEPELAALVMQQLWTLRHRAGTKNMLYGAFFFLGGLIFTGITYLMATEGGAYVIAYGAIVFGAIQFLRGWLQSQRKY